MHPKHSDRQVYFPHRQPFDYHCRGALDSLYMEEPITMTTDKTPRIAIIGAGPGGLTLARILQTRHIPTTVFERESHPDERPQGGSLDLHQESGQLAVHLAGLDEQFRAIARYEDQGMRLL